MQDLAVAGLYEHVSCVGLPLFELCPEDRNITCTDACETGGLCEKLIKMEETGPEDAGVEASVVLSMIADLQ
jgi:hypothetical protein